MQDKYIKNIALYVTKIFKFKNFIISRFFVANFDRTFSLIFFNRNVIDI